MAKRIPISDRKLLAASFSANLVKIVNRVQPISANNLFITENRFILLCRNPGIIFINGRPVTFISLIFLAHMSGFIAPVDKISKIFCKDMVLGIFVTGICQTVTVHLNQFCVSLCIFPDLIRHIKIGLHTLHGTHLWNIGVTQLLGTIFKFHRQINIVFLRISVKQIYGSRS